MTQFKCSDSSLTQSFSFKGVCPELVLSLALAQNAQTHRSYHQTAVFQEGGTFCNPQSPSVFQIEEISFKNYYTAYVTVRLLKRGPGQEAKWFTALRDLPLMDNPHTEGGSQDYCSIHRTQVSQSAVGSRSSTRC